MAQFPDVLELTSATLIRDPARLLLSLKQEADDSGRYHPVAAWPDLLPELEKLGLEVEGGTGEPVPGERRINHTAARLWVHAVQGELDDGRITRIRRGLRPHLDWVGPVYRPPGQSGAGAAECPFPHVVVVRPAPTEAAGQDPDGDDLAEGLERLGLVEVPGKSRWLGELRYFVAKDPAKRNAYALRPRVRKALAGRVADVLFEHMPMVSPEALVPSDPQFGGQWGLTRVGAPEAWDIATGDPGVIIAVIDSGCDLTHEDIAFVLGRGLDLETMSGDGSPLLRMTGLPNAHGTWAAGVAAATLDNGLDVAGMAGGCRILPLASTYTDMEVAAGIRYALDEGATVVNMSIFTSWITFLSGPIPAAIDEAERRGCVLVASSGDHGGGAGLVRPAEHPRVMACGASDMADERWVVRLADGTIAAESSYGDSTIDGVPTGVSVLAPGERIYTTDLMGGAGATPVNYTDVFNATSASTPFVAGLAALLQSAYPGLRSSAARVRSIIERTAEKVGPVPYVDMIGWPNGTRNSEYGYGRISARHALDLGDVLIRNWAGDDGAEPSTPPGGNFYSYSDIVVRPADDDVFMPGDVTGSSSVRRGEPAWIYVEVRNAGPAVARGVTVDVRVTPFVGLEFTYPRDWTRVDATHVQPAAVTASLGDLAPGGPPARATFSLTPTQVERLWDWTGRSWHPCVLARVTADNDYAFDPAADLGSGVITRRNNLAQRNLSVFDTTMEEIHAFRFFAGNEGSEADRIDIVVQAGDLARRGTVTLCLEPERSGVPGGSRRRTGSPDCGCGKDGTVFLDRTRIEVCLGGCRGVLTLEKGSRFDPSPAPARVISVEGGSVDPENGTCVRIQEPRAVIGLLKAPFETVPLALHVTTPADAQAGERFLVDVAQQNQGRTVGGAVAVYVMAD